MKNLLFLTFFLLPFLSQSQVDTTGFHWKYLLNRSDLQGWNTYLGPPWAANGKDRITETPIGLNKDPNHTFSMVVEDGKPALRISGQHFGGISTIETFENYHLQLQFKWGKLKWVPRKDAKRDSGVLYHANGEYGFDWGFWMRSQEFQIQEGDCGDFWGVGGGTMDIPVKKSGDKDWIYDAGGKRFTFTEDGEVGRHCIKSVDAENPSGEWNTIDIYCYGNTAVHMVNGMVNMILYNSQQQVDGKLEPLTSGKIEIQSEGAEVFYRNIRIRSITEIPAKLLPEPK